MSHPILPSSHPRGTCTTTRTLRVVHLGKHPEAAEMENPKVTVRKLQKPEPSDFFRICGSIVPSIFWTGQQCIMVFLPGLQTHSILTCHCSETFSISIQVVRPLFQESHSLSSLSLFLSSRFPHFYRQVFDLFPCFMFFSMSHVSCFFSIILQLQFHFNVEAFLISAPGQPPPSPSFLTITLW